MKLRRLCKSEESFPEGKCPAVYLGDDPDVMVCQGVHLDTATQAELLDVAPDEAGVALPTETVLRAAARLLAEAGHHAMVTEVEEYLAARAGERA